VSSNRTHKQPLDFDNDPVGVGGFDKSVDSRYNPADFVIPASDHQGHSERIYCRIQPQHARALSKILGTKNFPFRTIGDIQRWCVIRGMKVLNRLEPMPGFMGMADAINEVLRQEMYMQEFNQMFTTMSQVIQGHINAGATGEARRLLTTVLKHIRNIQEDYWKKKAEEEVRTRFGHLLESQGRTVNLRVVGQDDEEQE